MGLVPSLACSYIMIYLQKRNIFAEINKFQYTLPCGSDSETFTKSEFQKLYYFCQTTKCSVLIITDL